MKHTLIKIGFSVLLSLFISWVYLFTPQTYFSLDNKLRDFMFMFRGELPKSDKIVIIDIDNKSLKEVGQWPWSRDTIAKLISHLTEAKAGIIGLDMVFAEDDKSSPHLLKRKFPQISQYLPNYDNILAQTFSTSPVVGGYTFTNELTTDLRTPLIPAVFIQRGLHGTNYLQEPKGIVLNTPLLQSSLYSSGFFITHNNEGGAVREVPLIYKYKDSLYPSLALEMIRIYSGITKVDIIGSKEGIDFIRFGNFQIPTESSGEFIVNFRGPKKHFHYISASDILQKHFNPKEIAGKFVLLGTSAPGLKDLRYIAYDSTFPGVEVHANIIDNILEGDFIQRPWFTKLYDLAFIWILVFLLMFIFTYLTSWFILPFSLLLFSFMLYGLYLLLFDYGLVLTLVTPILAFVTSLILSIGIDYILTSKQKEQAKRMLGKKVSTSVMQHLLAHADEGLIESKEVEVTVFFSDIRDFTSISEQIGSPKKLIEMLNIYMTPMADTIIKHQGTIDKFIGDAIMAYWNTPVTIKNHADLAVTSALEQVTLLQKVNKVINAEYHVTIDIGIGLHTGIVTAGDMGSEGRSDYTIIGDNVNLASRIEGLTRIYDIEILISEETYTQLTDTYMIRAIDTVEVKGKKEAITVYQVLTEETLLSQEELTMHEQALKLFKENKIDAAYLLFRKLHSAYPCTLYAHFIQRCKIYIDNPNLIFSPILKMSNK